ncbi:MAG: zinc-binding dehydrogenase [Armatimonadetes bacterium]|nr:zinc-binding dehydrogenase [Armatimonadota bacterium]
MKAIVVPRCGETVWTDIPDLIEPGPYNAVAKVKAFTICNSTDLHLRDCRLFGATADSCPFLLGHESVGEIIEVGRKCRHLRVGDQILRPQAAAEGYESWWGGFAEFGLVSDLRAWEEDGSPGERPAIHRGHQVVPPEIAPGAAVVLITLKEVMSYLGRIGVGAGDRLLVMGHGPVGLAAAYLGKRLLGCERVVVGGRRPEAQAQIMDFGADAWVDLRKPDWPARAVELLGGQPTGVYDTTGQPQLVRAALGILDERGTLGPYAARPRDAEGEMPEDPRVIDPGTDESLSHDRIVQAVLDGAIDPSKFITHVMPPERMAEGFELIERREALKIVFEI